MAGAPYRIVYQRSDGQKFYFDREVESRDRFNVPCSQPHFSDDARLARKFQTPIEAVSRRDAFRKMWPRDRFFIESCRGDSDPLYESRTADVARTEAPADDRVPMHYAGFLFRPASLNRWCIRFSDNIETIYSDPGGSIEDLHTKLTSLFPQLVRFAEHFVPPEPTDAELAAQIRNAQLEVERARFPGVRRPGDRR